MPQKTGGNSPHLQLTGRYSRYVRYKHQYPLLWCLVMPHMPRHATGAGACRGMPGHAGSCRVMPCRVMPQRAPRQAAFDCRICRPVRYTVHCASPTGGSVGCTVRRSPVSRLNKITARCTCPSTLFLPIAPRLYTAYYSTSRDAGPRARRGLVRRGPPRARRNTCDTRAARLDASSRHPCRSSATAARHERARDER